MEKINCNISVYKENSIITISGIKDSDIEINYSGDVDFTELVNSLIIVIDEQKEVEYLIDNIPDDNEKLKLILGTIEDILKKYNENISFIEDVNENEDDNFWDSDTNNTTTTNTSNDDDLPF